MQSNVFTVLYVLIIQSCFKNKEYFEDFGIIVLVLTVDMFFPSIDNKIINIL